MLPTLDARLTAAAQLVRPGQPVADIGCDHGKLTAVLDVYKRQLEGPAGAAEKIIYRKNGGKFPWKTKKRPAINIRCV